MSDEMTEKDRKTVAAIKTLIDDCAQRTGTIREQWKLNFQYFVGGSQFVNKAEWQSDFSVNEIASAIRSAVGGVRSNFLRRPDWFNLQGLSTPAKKWEKVLDKTLRYQLKKACFRRKASTFLLMACTSLGAMRVGWKLERVKNPKLALEAGEKMQLDFDKKVASSVENPRLAEDPLAALSDDDIEKAISDFTSLATGAAPREQATPKFIQRGVLELTPINPINLFWDPSCQYLEESSWKAYEDWVPLWKLKECAKQGLYKNVDLVKPASDVQRRSQDARFANIQGGAKNVNDNLVKLTEYFGPVIIDNEIVYHDYRVVYANDSILLKAGPNPYWADGYDSPFITATAHEIPFRPTGAGIADNAIGLQRVLDSNYQLMTDQMRLGIVGINVIDRTKFIDPSGIQEGISPGKVYEVNGDPDKVFKHINITSNIENQVFPMNEILRQGIQKASGVSSLMQGAPNLRSRTSATEVSAQTQASDGHIYTISEDLEIQFLIPLLEKALARTLQFGLDLSDPEFSAILDEDEKEMIQSLSMESRYNSMAQFYHFDINGFGSEIKVQEQVAHINELLALYNTNGLVSQVLNGPALLSDLIDAMGFRDPSKYIIDNSEMEIIFSENRLLSQNQQVEVSELNNHQLHIQQHQKLLGTPGSATQALLQHVQQHMFLLQQQQAMAAQAQAQRDNPTGLPPQRTTGAEARNEPDLRRLITDTEIQ